MMSAKSFFKLINHENVRNSLKFILGFDLFLNSAFFSFCFSSLWTFEADDFAVVSRLTKISIRRKKEDLNVVRLLARSYLAKNIKHEFCVMKY